MKAKSRLVGLGTGLMVITASACNLFQSEQRPTHNGSEDAAVEDIAVEDAAMEDTAMDVTLEDMASQDLGGDDADMPTCDGADAEIGCESLSTDCQTSACDADSMSCITTHEPNGASCTDDGLDCTTDRCFDGVCLHDLDADFCLIDGACVADGAANPANSCEVCDVGKSTSVWTATPGASCDDGRSCTTGICDTIVCACRQCCLATA